MQSRELKSQIFDGLASYKREHRIDDVLPAQRPVDGRRELFRLDHAVETFNLRRWNPLWS